jgi:hypothetical protein
VLTPFNDENGVPYRKGEAIESDHWAVKKWPHFFKPFEWRHPVKRAAERPVEAATAGPGEKRGA